MSAKWLEAIAENLDRGLDAGPQSGAVEVSLIAAVSSLSRLAKTAQRSGLYEHAGAIREAAAMLLRRADDLRAAAAEQDAQRCDAVTLESVERGKTD